MSTEEMDKLNVSKKETSDKRLYERYLNASSGCRVDQDDVWCHHERP